MPTLKVSQLIAILSVPWVMVITLPAWLIAPVPITTLPLVGSVGLGTDTASAVPLNASAAIKATAGLAKVSNLLLNEILLSTSEGVALLEDLPLPLTFSATATNAALTALHTRR